MATEPSTTRPAGNPLTVPMRWLLAVVAGASLVGSGYALAQGTKDPALLERTVATRVAALEQRVTTLEQQNTDLRRFVSINGNSLTISSKESLKLSAGMGLDLSSATTFAAKGGTAMSLSAPSVSVKADADVSVAGATAKLSAQGALSLDGQSVKVNNGTRGVTAAGGAASPAVLVP
jgi:hypothetical protein